LYPNVPGIVPSSQCDFPQGFPQLKG
jgi:hypothetical protein